MAVPNRRVGRVERSFGHGCPFSGWQLRQLLKSHGFEPRQTHYAVYPAISWKVSSALGQQLNALALNYGRRCYVLLVEADKILYAASKGRKLSQRKISDTSVLIGQARDVLSLKILSQIQQ